MKGGGVAPRRGAAVPSLGVLTLMLTMLRWRAVQAIECPNSCGRPSGHTFCAHIQFMTCQTKDSWEQQDQDAQRGFQNWSEDAMTLNALPQYADNTLNLTTALNNLHLSNRSSACATILRNLQCAVHFPVCEIGTDYSLLCMNSCKESVKKQCPGLEGICTTFTNAEVDSKGKCFKLDYSGPSVGMWVAGFTISLVFSILNSIGINLQKLSLNRNERLPEEDRKRTAKQPLWLMGLALVSVGSVLDFVAFGMAPQTLLAPLAALSLVWNMMIAPVFHKEKVTRQNITATVIIFFGVILTVIFAGHSTPQYELEDLVHLYQQPAMYCYIFLVACFLLFLFKFSRHIEQTHQYENGFYHILCYGGIAGTFGGQSVLLAKSTVELVKSAIWGNGMSALKHVASYLIFFGMFGCLWYQVKFLNGGLRRFDALSMIPVYQSFWILMSVLGGIMYFEEYKSMSGTSKFMFTAGALITISGIGYLLHSRTADTTSERYVELKSVTPSSAWAADDSDEEEIQLKLDNHAALDDEDDMEPSAPAKIAPNPSAKALSHSASVSPNQPSSPTVKSSSSSSSNASSPRVSSSSPKSSAIAPSRIAPAGSPASSPKASSPKPRPKSDDDELFS